MADILRTHGISGATFYKWRSKYGGLEASEFKRVEELEQQLSEYKTMVAELTHDNRALKNLVEKSSSANRQKRCGRLPGWRKGGTHYQSLRSYGGWHGHRIANAQVVELRLMSRSLKCLIKWLLKMVTGVLDCVLSGCAIMATNGITNGYGEFGRRRA